MRKLSIQVLVLILVFVLSSCDKYVPPTFLSESRIVFVNDDILVNTADHEIVRYNNSLEEISRLKITDECDQMEFFKKNGDVYGLLSFSNSGILIKYDLKKDTIAWRSDTIQSCVYADNHTYFKENRLFIICFNKYIINPETGDVIEVPENDIDRTLLAINNIECGYFANNNRLYKTDDVEIILKDKKYSLSEDYIDYIERRYDLKDAFGITTWDNGFVVQSKDLVSILDTELNKSDSIVVDFIGSRFLINTNYLIIRNIREGVKVYNLDDLSKYMMISNDDAMWFIDAKIKKDKLYILTRDEMLEYPLEFKCDRKIN